MTPSPFRRDIEGLRGVAILLVVAFHARVPWLTGGYVAVDVFFVLSGFFLTALLAREAETTGSVDLATFYANLQDTGYFHNINLQKFEDSSAGNVGFNLTSDFAPPAPPKPAEKGAN